MCVCVCVCVVVVVVVVVDVCYFNCSVPSMLQWSPKPIGTSKTKNSLSYNNAVSKISLKWHPRNAAGKVRVKAWQRNGYLP